MKAINIEWDIDDEEQLEYLPTEIEIPKGMTDIDEISDYISDFISFCHKRFQLDNSRIIKLHFSMQEDFEIIRTNAPNSLIMAQLVYTNEREVAGEYVKSNYDIIEAMGFSVEIIGSHNDLHMNDFDEDLIDECFDYYDYYISKV